MSKLKPRKYFMGGAAPDGMYVSFPDDQIQIGPSKPGNVGGHGMVIAVDENTGQTRGSSYGRGVNNSGKHGGATRVSVPDFHPAVKGKPTEEELNEYAKRLAKRFPNWGGKVNVSYVPGANYDDMVEYMEEAEKPKSGYSKTPYNLYNHNCGVYGVSTINQAMPWYRKITGGLLNFVPGAVNTILGGFTGIGHDIEQGKPGTNTVQGITNFTGAGGMANMHGWSLPWGKTKGTNK